MGIGNSLYNARKRKGLSQEAVAEKLGVSRQTISKWETGETLPDIRQAKGLAALYGLSLDELIAFDADVQEVEDVVRRTTQETSDKVDWAKLWAEKYPVLARYQKELDPAPYARSLEELLKRLAEEAGYSRLDAFLVLKDILSSLWQQS